MSNIIMHEYVLQLEKARAETLAAAKAVPANIRLFQPEPGYSTPLWLLGHMASGIDAVLLVWGLDMDSVLTRDMALKFVPEFLGGKAPTNNPGDYPIWHEVVDMYEKCMDAAIAAVAVLDDAVLTEAPRGKMPDALLEYMPTIGDVLRQMVSHDAYHRGQLSLIAKLGRTA